LVMEGIDYLELAEQDLFEEVNLTPCAQCGTCNETHPVQILQKGPDETILCPVSGRELQGPVRWLEEKQVTELCGWTRAD